VKAGVDLGGTKIQTVVVRDEQVVGGARAETPRTGEAGDVIDAIAGTVRAALADAGGGELEGVGIGSPGDVDANAGVVTLAANVPGFGGRVELGPRVSAQLGGLPVVLGNDVNVAVLGTWQRGAGRPYRNLLGVWAGTGVGGGLVLDGRLYTGRGAAGEFGHMVVRPNGLRCGCGRRGCVEAYAGRASMERQARRLVKRGHKTSLFKVMEQRGRDRLTSGVFAKALDGGDAMAKKLIHQAAWALGVGIASAQNLLDLEAVVISGGLGDRLGKPFADQVVAHMTPHLFVPGSPPDVIDTGLGDLSGAIGAAVLAGG
jgi:glucokinase